MSQDIPSTDRVSANRITKPTQLPTNSRPRVCRFFNTGKGCRAGSQCPYQHVQPSTQATSTHHKHDKRPAEEGAGASQVGESRQAVAERPSGPVPSRKPASQLQQTNPREFQIGQVIKRFSPVRKEIDDVTILSLILQPSDPDFPFELSGLRCNLIIPATYPQNGRSTIQVTNTEMARGYQINVEKGFDSLVSHSPNKTLLALLNDLDKNLEQFLTAEKAQTIKIIANAERKPAPLETVQQVVRSPSPKLVKATAPTPSWSAQQTADAKAKRLADIRQLEARMGRLQGFSKTSDGTRFNIPVQIANTGRLPAHLQPLKEVTLTVPKLYNLEPCTVHLNGVYGPEVESVQLSFEKRSRDQSTLSLMAHINHLTQNIHNMAAEPVEQERVLTEPLKSRGPVLPDVSETRETDKVSEDEGIILDPERAHIRVIPRPPEWDRNGSDSDYESDSYDSEEYTDSEDNYDEDEDATGGGAALPTGAASSPSAGKGILLSFPNLELHGIELLTLTSISLSIKCLRCKSPLDVSNIKPNNPTTSITTTTPSTTTTRSESCPKCATIFTIAFIPQLLHQNSFRPGTFEMTGCTITDLLPSTFQPTCSTCSTPFPTPPGMISVRGDRPIQVCRSCHSKMSFSIPEVKFLRLSPNRDNGADLPLRNPRRENLGVTAGTPLPSNGTCPHYTHSYRWFRFSCCGRVYACDRCHDAAEKSHVNDRAERMLCGWCSREQRFRPEDCGFCGRTVVRRRRGGAGAGFWEGGKGTRERGLMSRKEKRKYRHKRSDGAEHA